MLVRNLCLLHSLLSVACAASQLPDKVLTRTVQHNKRISPILDSASHGYANLPIFTVPCRLFSGEDGFL
jgi:hypothetical protein